MTSYNARATIVTISGTEVHLLEPDPESIHLADIAHGLALCNRFSGHTVRPYSVAEHSLLVARHCSPKAMLLGLMHDASEAYLGDMVGPLKVECADFQRIEYRMQRVIELRFGLNRIDRELRREVKRVDRRMLVTEARDLCSSRWNWRSFDAAPYEFLLSGRATRSPGQLVDEFLSLARSLGVAG